MPPPFRIIGNSGVLSPVAVGSPRLVCISHLLVCISPFWCVSPFGVESRFWYVFPCWCGPPFWSALHPFGVYSSPHSEPYFLLLVCISRMLVCTPPVWCGLPHFWCAFPFWVCIPLLVWIPTCWCACTLLVWIPPFGEFPPGQFEKRCRFDVFPKEAGIGFRKHCDFCFPGKNRFLQQPSSPTYPPSAQGLLEELNVSEKNWK